MHWIVRFSAPCSRTAGRARSSLPSGCRCRRQQSPAASARLEEAGVIQGYQARVNRKALGLSMTVIVHVSLNSQNQDLLKAFEDAVAKAPSVVSCHLMSGEDDYLVTVMARDLADYERIHKEQLSRLPGVARLKSSFVLRDIVNKPLPASCLLPSRK